MQCPPLIKYLLMMKLAILLVLVFSTQSYARLYGQQHSISLRLEKVQLKKVFRAIENQSFFRFVYNDDVIPREQLVTINVKEASIDEVLQKVLTGTPLKYRKLGDNLFDFFHCQIAGEIRAQSGQTVRGEEAQTPLAELREISRVDTKSFERATSRFS